MLLVILLTPGLAGAVPIRSLGGLVSIIFYERTGGSAPTAHVFVPDDDRILSRFITLDAANRDFFGTSTESYDVFYSDADGTLNPDGMYLTIQALYPGPGAGHNLAEAELVFDTDAREFASVVTASNAVGTESVDSFAASAANAADGNLLTHTSLGISTDQADRLSVTLGFASTVPAPASLTPLVVAGMLRIRRRR